MKNHKFKIGDLVCYKEIEAHDYLFGKDYGIVIGFSEGQENQIYYKIRWANDHPRNILDLFCYAQLELIASTREA